MSNVVHQTLVQYHAVIVKPEQLLSACLAAEEYAKRGIIQMIFLEGQEAEASEWELEKRRNGRPSDLAMSLCRVEATHV